ncbi:MAG: hypothetical protein CM15mP62_28320 [Rhodospirillaceae bacterium]|nr:MAG: hypothetical protein CM15mP62_28320 [Rhodospirillaceae bacterium]
MPVVRHPDGEIYFELLGTGVPILFLLPQSVGPNGTKALVNSLSKNFLLFYLTNWEQAVVLQTLTNMAQYIR